MAQPVQCNWIESFGCDYFGAWEKCKVTLVSRVTGRQLVLVDLAFWMVPCIFTENNNFLFLFIKTDQLTKEKVEEIYKTREEQIYKKQKILEELQKVCVCW